MLGAEKFIGVLVSIRLQEHVNISLSVKEIPKKLKLSISSLNKKKKKNKKPQINTEAFI